MIPNISIEDAKVVFRNFSGEEGRFNKAGQRNFCVLLEPEDCSRLAADGWNIKYLKPKEEGDEPQPYLPVSVTFGKIPPKIVLVNGSGKKMLDQKNVNILDWVEIATADILIRPYEWEVNGDTGVKAYLKAIYVTIVEDEFEAKYRDVPDTAKNTITED